jgi:hypothetical protein
LHLDLPEEQLNAGPLKKASSAYGKRQQIGIIEEVEEHEDYNEELKEGDLLMPSDLSKPS